MTTPTLRSVPAAETLVDRAVRGDTAATGQLLKQLAPSMIRAARSLLGATHADVDDVVQQSLIGLVQSLPAFRGECSVAHFASRQARDCDSSYYLASTPVMQKQWTEAAPTFEKGGV